MLKNASQSVDHANPNEGEILKLRRLGLNMKRRIFTTAVMLLTCLALSGPSLAQSVSADSVIETIKKRGAIKIGLSIFKPWSMRDKNGELIGFELDVGAKLAEDMGVDAEFIPTAWDGIIPALVSGKFDVIISGMTTTPQRNLTINFTDPYAYSGLTILANTEMTEGLAIEDYNSSDITFAARRGCFRKQSYCCSMRMVLQHRKCLTARRMQPWLPSQHPLPRPGVIPIHSTCPLKPLSRPRVKHLVCAKAIRMQ